MSHNVTKEDYNNTKLLRLGNIKKKLELTIFLTKDILVHSYKL